jgi:predicted TIM-barrel enzyme
VDFTYVIVDNFSFPSVDTPLVYPLTNKLNFMPNPYTGIGNPYTRTEVLERLNNTLSRGESIIVAGAGCGISAKFIEKGGADMIIIYASGRFRMAGAGSIAGMMAYGDANAIAMDIGEYEVLPVVNEIPVICGIHASDPRRRMWHWLEQVKAMGFSGINNFPTHTIIDGQFGQSLEETNMGVQKEIDTVALARKMDIFTITYVATPEEAQKMAAAGADAVIAHVGCTVGGSIGVSDASIGLDQAAEATQAICEAAHSVRKDVMVLSHGGPILTPADAAYINERTDTVGFVGASSIERMAVEESITDLTREFKAIPVKRIK